MEPDLEKYLYKLECTKKYPPILQLYEWSFSLPAWVIRDFALLERSVDIANKLYPFS